MNKKFLITTIFLFSIAVLFAQTADQIKPLKLKKKGDFKAAEPEILLNAKFILGTPVNPDDAVRGLALQNIVTWMEKTPDRKFIIDDSVIPVIQKSTDTMGEYMAAMIKFVLENPDQSYSQDEIKLNAFGILLDYISVPSNGIPQTKEIVKAIEAKNKNKLKEYLNIP